MPLEDADAELAVALDGDDAGVRQPAVGVAFEIDAFLEVDEVETRSRRANSRGRGC